MVTDKTDSVLKIQRRCAAGCTLYESKYAVNVLIAKASGESSARLFNEIESTKVILGPADLEKNDAAKRADGNGVGFLVTGDVAERPSGCLKRRWLPLVRM